MSKTEFVFAMKLRTSVLVTTTVFLLFASFNLLAREQNNPLVDAIKLYDQAKYVEAEKLLKPLLDENPDQLMVNYYYGACRTENGHYGQNEISCLQKGSTGESPLKTDYYLAVQYHALSQWDDALRHYLVFKDESDANEQNELNLAQKIEQCKNRVNPFEAENEEADLAPVPVQKINKQAESDSIVSSVTPVYPGMEEADSVLVDSLKSDIATNEIEVTEQEIQVSPTATMPVDFKVNGEMTYLDTSDFQTDEGLFNYLQWNKSAKKLDSLKNKMDDWRKAYANATTSSLRNSLGEKIIAAESELFSLQKETKDYETLALKAENDFWNSQAETARIAFAKQLSKRARKVEKEEETIAEEIDSTLILPGEVIQNMQEVIPATEEKEKTELVYKIQIGAYSRGLPNYVKTQFDKLAYIRKIENYTDDRGVVVYTTGNLTRLEDAVKMQNQVRLEGIEDAFVVPYFNGKRITLEEAKKLEQGNDR